jgi:hypothetical protein
MSTPLLTDGTIKPLIKKWATLRRNNPLLSNVAMAAKLDISPATLRRYLLDFSHLIPEDLQDKSKSPFKRGQNGRTSTARILAQNDVSSKGLDVGKFAEEEDLTIEEIIELKKKVSKRVIKKAKWAELIPVNVQMQGPVGLTVLGDPHVDDDGCDIARLESDLNICTNTAGLFLGHVGDITNNWIGRLAAKYADQVARKSDAKKLIEWVLKGRPNLFAIKGNHDMWQDTNLIDWALDNTSTVSQPHGVRLQLNFPQGESMRIHARHDFPGNSIYNASHGLRRETLFGFKDHILLAGHRHVDAHAMVAHPDEPYVSHLYRVSGYKIIDDYADERRFIPMRFAPSVTLILNPMADLPAERVKGFWDTEAAADYLTWLRRHFK